MRRSRLSQPAGCPQVHRRDFQNPAGCGHCGQPAAAHSDLTNNTVTLPSLTFGSRRPLLGQERLLIEWAGEFRKKKKRSKFVGGFYCAELD